MNFKFLKVLALAVVLATGSAFAEELSKADQKWSKVVEEMIVKGPATIATPKVQRVEIAKKLAEKHGRKVEVVKKGKSFHLTIS